MLKVFIFGNEFLKIPYAK